MEGVKKFMSQEKKTVEICVRVTPTEKKELQEKADVAHLSLKLSILLDTIWTNDFRQPRIPCYSKDFS